MSGGGEALVSFELILSKIPQDFGCLLVVGGTGSGKTRFVEALLKDRGVEQRPAPPEDFARNRAVVSHKGLGGSAEEAQLALSSAGAAVRRTLFASAERPEEYCCSDTRSSSSEVSSFFVCCRQRRRRI